MFLCFLICLQTLFTRTPVSTGRVWSSARFVFPLWKLLFWVQPAAKSLPALLVFPPIPLSRLSSFSHILSFCPLLSHLLLSPLLLKCNPRPWLIDGGMMKVAGGGMVVPCFLLLWWNWNPACVSFWFRVLAALYFRYLIMFLTDRDWPKSFTVHTEEAGSCTEVLITLKHV